MTFLPVFMRFVYVFSCTLQHASYMFCHVDFRMLIKYKTQKLYSIKHLNNTLVKFLLEKIINGPMLFIFFSSNLVIDIIKKKLIGFRYVTQHFSDVSYKHSFALSSIQYTNSLICLPTGCLYVRGLA